MSGVPWATRARRTFRIGAIRAGLWLGGVSGDRETLVYAVTSVDFVRFSSALVRAGSACW